ncbi:MAG: two-component system sensor histidine kinase TctE [Granulosicoccus sp.]|jgi:two-component system sensor histidine kinase TctE
MTNNPVYTSGSLRNKLAVRLIGGVLILTVLLFFVVRNYAAQIAQQSQDSILRASVTSMLDTANIQDGVVEMDIPYSSFSILNTPTDDRIFYAIYQDDRILSGYDDLAVPPLPANTTIAFQSTVFGDVPVRQVTATRILIGAELRTQITASVAQTQDNLSGTLKRISQHAAVLGAGFFSLAMLLSIWAAAATIGPLRRLASSVTRRGPEDLSPVVKPVPLEMAPLVLSLNSLMARLERSLNQSEDFIAEAAHRMRTPIATVRSHAEATLQRVDKEENRRALRSMIYAIDESSRAAGQLLDHAMIIFRSNQLECNDIDLVDLVQEIVLRITPLAEMRDVELRLESDQIAIVSGDSILLQNAIRNLIDNAMKYSPSESVIFLVVRANPKPYLEVRDQGPGFLTDEIELLTGRFTRGRNASGTIGSGLGLTIARDVAVAHGGQLKLSNNSSGGACVTFSF